MGGGRRDGVSVNPREKQQNCSNSHILPAKMLAAASQRLPHGTEAYWRNQALRRHTSEESGDTPGDSSGQSIGRDAQFPSDKNLGTWDVRGGNGHDSIGCNTRGLEDDQPLHAFRLANDTKRL